MINYINEEILMNKKILLALLPPWGDCSTSPLGIPSITSNLLEDGYEVIQKDYNVEVYYSIIKKNNEIFSNPLIVYNEHDYNEKIFPLIKDSLNKWVNEIIDNEVPIIGLSAYCTNIITIRKISEIIKVKAPENIIIVGGPEAAQINKIAAEYIDFIIIGEGEVSLRNLIKEIYSPCPDYKRIKGIFYKDKESKENIFTGDNTFARMDDLPIPDFKDIDFGKYRWSEIPIESSRGCINKCSFCSDILLQKKYRFKTAKRLFDEVSHFAKLGHRSFGFVDSLINGNITELEKFCDLIIGNKLKIFWTGNACIRKEMSYDLLKKMITAGCFSLNYGLESGSDDVLKMMNKRFSVPIAGEVLKNTRMVGIKVSVYILIGFPTETNKNFEETLNFITENKKYINYIFMGGGCVISKDSDLYNDPEKYGIYWSDDVKPENRNGHNWHSKETNPEIRRNRVEKMIEHCKSLKIRFESLI
jgi:anaerobic magnesium-protoporphyrin IX monomethyl ester cyclase